MMIKDDNKDLKLTLSKTPKMRTYVMKLYEKIKKGESINWTKVTLEIYNLIHNT